MHKPAHPEIEALRRRWREILKRAREKGDKPSKADIDAASMVDDPELSALVADTESALEEHSKRRLVKLNTNINVFQPAKREDTSAIELFLAAEILARRTKKFRP